MLLKCCKILPPFFLFVSPFFFLFFVFLRFFFFFFFVLSFFFFFCYFFVFVFFVFFFFSFFFLKFFCFAKKHVVRCYRNLPPLSHHLSTPDPAVARSSASVARTTGAPGRAARSHPFASVRRGAPEASARPGRPWCGEGEESRRAAGGGGRAEGRSRCPG